MNIEQALKDNPAKEERIKELAGKAKIAELLLELKSHAGMEMLLSQLMARVDSINQTLCWDRKTVLVNGKPTAARLSDIERAEMNVRREELTSIIELFPEAEKKLENIAKKIKSYERG